MRNISRKLLRGGANNKKRVRATENNLELKELKIENEEQFQSIIELKKKNRQSNKALQECQAELQECQMELEELREDKLKSIDLGGKLRRVQQQLVECQRELDTYTSDRPTPDTVQPYQYYLNY